MDGSRRRQVLQRIGIETWRRRDAAPPAAFEPEQPGAIEMAEAEHERLSHRPEAAAAVAQLRAPPSPSALPVGPAGATPLRAPGANAAPPPEVAGVELLSVPGDWDGLREMVRDCPRCKLCHTRNRTVFGVGPENAPLLLIGEAPGADEDAQGEPFVGRAGQLLDEMLSAIGRSRRDNVYIANVVKCRPPANREPEADEVASCRPYLEQQIRLIRPRLIVSLGRISAQMLLDSDAPLSRLRGTVHRHRVDDTPLIVTYHPAYLLRSPREKAKSWADLKMIHRFLASA